MRSIIRYMTIRQMKGTSINYHQFSCCSMLNDRENDVENRYDFKLFDVKTDANSCMFWTILWNK